MRTAAKFRKLDIIEQVDKGDYPAFVTNVYKTGAVWRYDLIAIDEVVYENIPEYMLRSARPSSESMFSGVVSARDNP